MTDTDAALVEAAGFGGARLVARGGAARVYRVEQVGFIATAVSDTGPVPTALSDGGPARTDGGMAHAALNHGGLPLALKVVDPLLADGLEREARLLRLVGPPVVPAVLASHRQLLVLEWLEGSTLSTWAAQATEAARQAMALTLCETLAQVHRAGVVHRDVKGSNVMVLPSGQVRWFDFGLACEEGGLEPPRQGTAVAMAPESWEGGRVTARTDVYGLGVLLYGLLTGREPFRGDSAQLERAHRQERPPPSGLKPALDSVLTRCLAKNPAERFRDAAEVGAALTVALRADDSAPPAPQPLAQAVTANPTALLAVRSQTSVPQLSRAMEAEGAIWAGTSDGAQLFARPHPLGPASGLERLLSALTALPSVTSSTLHVAPLTVRVGRSSVRVTGSALEDTRWVVGGPGAHFTAPALEHRAARPTPAAARVEPPWLEDGSRLPAVVAALEGPGPRLVWVCAPSGSGRTRLLRELAAQLGARARWLSAHAEPNEVLDHAAEGGVLLVDGAERVGWAMWEALEAVTAPSSRSRLDVVVAGDAQVAVARPGLGTRAAAFTTVTPRLLSEAEAERLVRALLVPAQLLPSGVVEQLARAGDGHAGHLVELVEVLRRRGLLAPDAVTGEWRLSSEALGGELTARLSQAALAELPSALHDVARLLALARWPISAGELQRALEALPVAFEARRLDADAVIGRLVSLGIVERVRPAEAGLAASVGWLRRGVRQALVAEGGARVTELHRGLAVVLEGQLPAAALEEEVRVETAALVGLSPSAPRAPSSSALRQRRVALAHHAHAAGWNSLARVAASAVGLEALAQGDALEADAFLSRALASLSPPTDGALRLARARARRQLEHFEAALEDARSVEGDSALRVAALLEASLALDWLNQFHEANAEAEAALALSASDEGLRGSEREEQGLRGSERLEQGLRGSERGPGMSSPLGRALLLARGRLAVRAGRWAEAAAALDPLCVAGVEPGEVETVLGAYALAGSVACVEGRLARAEHLFAEGLQLAQAHGQPVVGCALLINRPMLWMMQGRIEEALADFRSAAEISRRLGHAQIERVASLNLAQYLLWQGRFAEAEPLAQRAASLAQLRLGSRAPPTDCLLLARLALARGDWGEARARLAEVDARSLNPSDALQQAVVRAWVGAEPWVEVLAEREGVVPEELLDAALVAREHAADPADRLLADRAIERLRAHANLTRPRLPAPRATGL